MKKGFTVLELLISLMLLTVILAAIYTALNMAVVSSPVDLGLLELQQQTRQATNWLTRETREGNATTTVVTPVSADFDNLTFYTPNESGGIQYSVTSGQLQRAYAGTTRIIARDITSLKFTKTTSTLTIDVRASRTVLKRFLVTTLTEKVRFRN